MKRSVEYFERPGPQNTEACMVLVDQLVQNEGYKDVVVASTSGDTGLIAARRLQGKGVNLVIVAHSVGFQGPNQDQFSENAHQEITSLGGRVYKGTILTHSIETSIAKEFSGSYPTLLVANTLRRFGHGTKVCCEIVMEAVDAGLIAEGQHVVAVAGTGKGADTVAILKSAASKRFLELFVSQIVAKPAQFK
ncbi:MAG: pyruvate kinase alpha/beta domain-containing protein [Deltaproteobacteria bacterium]